MSDPDYWWEPPMAGTEAEHLVGALDRMRTTFRWKADELDAEQLRQRIGASSLTIGGLLKHLASCENYLFTTRLYGAVPDGPRPSQNDDFTSAAHDTPEALYAMWDEAVARSRATLTAALADGGLDQPTALEYRGTHASLRRLLCDFIEEYGRHTGHADLIREAIDGRVGEDPPAGWQPVGARLR
jgi:uncharacterized damage-inducible protein DinB